MREFLEFARPAEPQLISTPLQDLLEEVNELLAPLWRRQNLQVSVECPPDQMVLADPAQLKQVLINLAQNAVHAAMAGRTSVMTAIFTPGYAAAEQMTSAKQGPWSDIYGLSATLYHAITGQAPPSAFDRMLEDGCQPLARLAPAGFSPGLLVGIDAGLAEHPAEVGFC
mgnify:CR=1 FL=1